MLGILCGLESEAVLARRVTGALVAVSAARPEQARTCAQGLVQQGATRLLSFGLAGGLKAGLPAGSVVIGTAVCAAGDTRPADLKMIEQLRTIFPAAQSGAVWASDSIIARAGAKRALFYKTNCFCADMESHAVAWTAVKARIPFAVLRAVADTAEMDLPPAAQIPLRGNGKVDLPKVLLAITCAPRDIPALIRLGVNTGLALKSLRPVLKAGFS